MIATLQPSSEDRAWRLGVYALATLIHVPLIVAVQQFGLSIASSRPAESVITLLDTPDVTRAETVAAPSASLDAVTDSAISVAPIAATRLESVANPLTPVPSLPPPDVARTPAPSVADIIASNTVVPVPPGIEIPSPRPDVAPITPVETPALRAAPAIATSAAQPLATASASPIAAASTTPSASAVSVPAVPSAPVAVSSSAPAEAIEPTATPLVAVGTAPTPAASSASPLPSSPAPSVAAAPVVASAAPSTVPSSATLAPPRISIPAARIHIAAARAPAESGSGRAVTSSTRSPASSSSASIISPTRPAPVESIGAVAARTIGATTVTAPAPTPLSPIAVKPVAPITARPVEEAPQTAAVSPNVGDTGPDRAALNDFMRDYQGGGCFAALTVDVAGTAVAVSGFSRDESDLAGFEAALANRAGPSPSAAGRQVSQAQCSALAFARSQTAYPDFSVRLRVDPDRIPSGGTIRGRLTGVGARPVTMLILDDEGRIQDASFLLGRDENGDWSFETPLSLTGDPVPTVQLFVALAGDGPLAAMRPPVPVEARRYFTEIDRLLKTKNQSLDVALAAFTVDRRAAEPSP